MNTEQLAQFPMGIITDADVAEHHAQTPVIASDEMKTWFQIGGAVVAGFILLLAVSTVTMAATMNGKLTRIEASKALFLTWVSPEKGEAYIMEKTRIVKP